MRVWWVGLLLAWHAAFAESDPFPDIASAYLVHVNQAVLWQKNADRKLPPASLTKLMTVLLVLENTSLNETVQMSRKAVGETGSRLGAKVNSRFSAESLLKAVLLSSANDACLALAEHVSGSERKFVMRMNKRAQEMRMADTHFENACGHDAENHYSTADDLAKLSYSVMQNTFVQSIVRLASDEIVSSDGRHRFRIANKNALIGHYEGAVGLKTGFTRKAGKCLIVYAKRRVGQHEKNVLLVMLNAPNRWWDAVDVLDLAFSNASAQP